MKYLFYCFIVVAFVFSGLYKENGTGIRQAVDDRLNETLTSFQTY
jgi:hypothetical protein